MSQNLTSKLFKFKGAVDAVAHLETQYAIKAKVYPNFTILNYNQIESPKTDPYVIECRSLIIDNHTGEVAGRAFPRFFNLGEAPDLVQGFDFSQARVMEKADGSLIKFWYNKYDERWEISTRGSAFGEAPHAFIESYRKAIIEEVFQTTEEHFQANISDVLKQHSSYVFEYVSPTNRIVTRYTHPQLILTAIIENETGIEHTDPDVLAGVANTITFEFERFGLSDFVRPIKFYDLKSADEIVEATKTLDNLEEGFVVLCTVTGKRIKVKSLKYLTVHKIRGEQSPTPKSIAQLIAENEQDEFLAYFPEYQSLFDPYIAKMAEIRSLCEDTFSKYNHISDRKEYALLVKDLFVSSLLFTMKNKNVSFNEAWEAASESYKVSIISGE